MEYNKGNLRGVYDTLKNEGYTPPEFDEFVNDMQDESNLRDVHSTLRENGYTPPDFDAFKKDMLTPVPAIAGAGVLMGRPPVSPGKIGKQLPTDLSPSVDIPQEDWEDNLPSLKSNSQKDVDARLSDTLSRFESRGENLDRMAERYSPEGRERKRRLREVASLTGLDHRLTGIASAPTPAPADGGQNEGGEPQERVFHTYGAQLYDFAQGSDGALHPVYELEDGSLTDDVNVAESAEAVARKDRRDYAQKLRLESPEGMLADIEARLADVNMRINRSEKELIEAQNDFARDNMFTAMYSAGVGAARPVNRGDKRGADKDFLLAERDMLEDARRRMSAAVELEKSQGMFNGVFDVWNNVKNLSRGAIDALKKPSVWTFGMTDVRQASHLLGIKNRLDRGEELTETEMSFAMTAALVDDFNGRSEEMLPTGYLGGEIIGDMAPFMAQMALSPASGFGKALARQAVRKFGREGAKAVLMRGAARVVGDIGAAAFLANTLQLTTTSADIVRRHTGRVSLSETGGVEFVGGESWAEAIAKGEGAMVIENFTEYLGEHAFKALGMPIVKGARKLAGKSRVGRDVMDFISNVELSGFGKAVSDLERCAQWNGSVSEILEEEVGIVLNSIFVGDNELKDLVDPREQSLIIIGCGVFGGFVSGLKSAGYMSDRYYGRRVLNNADMRAGAVLGDGWADVRKRIDEADIDGLADILASYISDFRAGNVNEMTVRAVCDYAVSLQRYRGGNIATERARMEGLSDAVLRNLSQAEDAGYEMSESSEMRDAQSEYERQRARLVGELGGHGLSDLVETVLNDIDRDPVGALSRTHEESLRGVVLDYVNAMMVRRGVIGRVRDDIDGRVAASDTEVDMRVNKDTGMIHPATVGIDGRAVFIVGGTVSVRDDGSVDFSRSDESVVVKDAATGRLEFVPVRSVKSIGTAIDPASEKTAAAEAIRQEAAQAAVDAMNGTLALNPGDVVQIHDGGGLVDVTVVGPAVNEESGAAVEDRVLVRFPNGSETSFTREQLQAFADAANIERLDRLEQERAGANANDAQTGTVEAEVGHGEEMVPRRFALNDEFTILKEDGTTVGGTVTGELDSDGKVEVSTDEPINGNVVNLFTPAELEEMLDTYNGESVTAQSEKGDSVADVDVSSGLAEQSDARPADAVSMPEGVVRTESEEASRGGETTSDNAVLRVPVDEQGQPRYEEAEPDIAWDAIVEQAKGDEAKAQRVVESMLSDMESEVKRLENKKPDKGRTVAEKMAAEDALEERRATAKSNLDKWRAIAGVAETRRAAAVEAEKRARIEAELAEEQLRRRAEREAREKEEQQKRREQEDKALKEGSPATYRKLMANWSEPHSVEEYILRQLASGYVKLRWESAANGRKGIFDSIFGGRSNRDKGRGSEWQKRRWMIDDIDGLSVDAYIERVAQEFYSDYERDTDHWQEVSNALFDILRSCDTSKSMYEYALELHRNAETVADGSFEAEMAARGITQDDLDRMDAFYEKYGMTEDEWDEFYAAHGHVIDLADAEYEELMTTIEGEIADEYANRQSKELAADSEGQSGAEGTGESGTYVVLEGGLHEQSSRTGRESRNSPQGGGDVSIREESSDKAPEEIDKADELTTARRAKQEVESINDEVNIPTILQWSNERAGNGEPFLLGSNGSINLVEIEQEVFDKIGIGKAPFRLTPSMVTHVYERHKKELKLNSPKDAVEAILDVMNNFDHVRKGRDNTYIFSVEGARNNSARRAVTLVLEYDKGEWLGIKTVGYDRISNLKEMTTLWEKGEGNSSATGVAPANVSSEQPSQGNKAGGIASNQSAVVSDGKVTDSASDKQEGSLESSQSKAAQPTEAQKAAGNYKMEHRRVDGYNISIENAKGSVRRGIGADGKQWETTMQNDYGYIRGTEGVDGDHIDVFLTETPEEGDVFVVDQVNEDGSFDEHKVMYGFPTEQAARDAYLSNYEPGWTGLGAITHVSKDEFKKWIQSSRRKTKPFAEYKSVKPIRYDNMGNPIDSEGNLVIEDVKSLNDISDSDFSVPSRSVGLPTLPQNVGEAIGTDGRKVIIKKNIFIKNHNTHPELTPADGRDILHRALYNPNLVGTTQPIRRPDYKVAIQTGDKNAVVVLDVYAGKDNVEIVGWRKVDGKGLEKMKRQAEREGGQFLILSPDEGSAAALSALPSDVSSDGKVKTLSADKQEGSKESSLGERVDEDGVQPADVKEKSPAEGKLTEFALKFKDTDIDVRAIEREMSEWLSGQTADSLSNVDANMLYRICSVAGLDKGKALAFRKSIDNAMPKDLLSEVWELRRRKNQQSESDKPAFSIDEKTEGNKAAYDAAKRLLEAAGLEVVEVSDAEARAKLDGKGDARLMGSRTDKKMAKVSEHYAGRELDANTQAVVDVFSGKADNAAIEVERADGKRRVIMRQGDENRAGTKHSLFRHFETKSNYIMADDITMVPEVIAMGERSVNGKKIAYDYVTEDGTRLRVTTEKHGEKEQFTNFLSNRKPLQQKSVENTQSAHRSDAEVSDAKVRNNSETGKSDGSRKALRTSDGVVYGWTEGGKVYLNRGAMNPETPVHEYTHLWDDMVRRENPELWARGKELLRQTPLWDAVVNDPNYADIASDEDAVASEVHSRLTGAEGARLMQDMIDKARQEGAMATAEAVTLVERLKGWLQSMFKALKATLSKWSRRELDGLTLEDFNNMTLRDLAEGVNPRSGDKVLVAVHNLSEDKLREALGLGGFPMPSIAVTKAGVGHGGFGAISLVFGKSTIDPSDRRNKVYGGDAWTPTFPAIGYKFNGSKTREIYERANRAGKLPLFKAVDFHPDNYERRVDSRNDASLVDAFKEDYGAKQLFLSEKGNAVEEYESRAVEKYSADDISLYEKVLETFGEERLREDDSEGLRSELGRLIGEHRGKDMDSLKPFVRKALVSNTIRRVLDYYDNGNVKTETDLEATRAKIDGRVDEHEFQTWLEEIFAGVVEKKGIRNERDMFTPSGEIRKWESLYDAVTLDNVVKAMMRQSSKGGTGFFNGSIFGASAKEFENIEDVRREAARRIASVPGEELQAEKERISSRLEGISLPSVSGSFSSSMDFVDNVIEAVAKSHTAKGIYGYLRKIYPDMTMSVAEKIADIVSDIQKMSTRYFEAKPQRAVGFEEVRLAVVPEGTSADIIRELEGHGIPVKVYERGNELQRSSIINRETSERDLRFHAAMSQQGRADFNALRERAIAERGVVMPGLNEAYVHVVDVPRHDFMGTGKQALNAAETWAKKHIVGKHPAKDSNGEAFVFSISNDAVEKFVSRSSTEKSENIGVHLAALKKLPRIIAESIEAEIHPDYNKGKDGKRHVKNGYNPSKLVHRFYGAINIEGIPYRVKTTIEEFENKGFPNAAHSYEVTEIEAFIEETTNTSIDGALTSTSSREGILGIANLLKGVEKSYDSGKLLLDESEKLGAEAPAQEHKADGSVALGSEDMMRDGSESAAGERQRIVDRIKELAGKLHLDKNQLEIVTDASQLEGKRAKAKGFFNKRTGKITIVIPNNVSTIDAEQTLLHEAVAHYGLRQLFGDRFDAFLDNVYESADFSIRRKIAEMAAKNGWDFRTATEEYLAGLAEEMNFENARGSGLWSSVKGLFLDMLEYFGFKGFRDKAGVELTDNELRYILWRSYENLTEPGGSRSVLGEAADVSMQAELKVGNYAEQGVEAEYAAEPENTGIINERFNNELSQYENGTLPKGHRFELGMPSRYLRSAGFPNLPISMRSSLLARKAGDEKHPFEASDIKGLVEAIQKPIAIFEYTKSNMRNLIVDVTRGDKHFLVGVTLNYKAGDIEINSVSGLFPKESHEWVKWIQDGKAIRIDQKEKVQKIIDSLRTNPAESERIGLNLDDAAKVVNTFENPTIEEEELFRPGDFTPRDKVLARAAYERICASGGYQFREALQDSMLGLKTLYQAVLGKKTRIEDVPGFENAYLFENRMSSMNAGEQHEYFQRYMKPLLKEIGRIAGAKKRKRRELMEYIMAKHGLERNAYMRKEAAANKEATDRDFAGLMGLTGEADWRSAEATAQQWVDDYENEVDTTALWEAINKATKATLEKVYLSGIISKETYDKILGMYDYYVPLRGWDVKTSDQVYGYLTSKDGPLGGSIMKRAEGRESMADDPIATISMMADDAIRQGLRNLMKQRFLNFVLNHPSDAVSVQDLWLEYNAVKDEWVPVFADVVDTDTADDVAQKVEAFEQRMEALRKAEPDKYKKGREAQNIPYKVVRGNLKEHQVLIKRGGRTFVVTINGNPRAAQAINGLTNPDVELNGVQGKLSELATWINRQLSAAYTTRNPNFSLGNFIRDMLYTNCMTWVKESPRYALRFHKNFGRFSPPIMRYLLGKWEKGTLDMSKRYESLFYQFMIEGGETGYTNVRDIESHKRAVAAELKKQSSVGRRVWAALGMQFDLLNRSAENCARFAAFVTSREFGRSIDRAIYDAKEVSVNFNKKGSGGKMVNATGQTALGKFGGYLGGLGRLLYVFWNAGVQGMTNFGRQAKLHPAKFSAGAGATLLSLGCLIPLLAQGDGDDDDKNAYYNLPEHVRRSNICFRAGDQWMTIPLPIEFRAMYGMGELAYGVLSGNERYSDSELAKQMAAQVSQIFPIDMLEGGGGISPFIPSAAKPFTEAYIMNKSWTGLPVYRETPFNEDDPEWTKAYASTDKHLVDFARWLNETSGGDDFKKGSIDINPARIEHMLRGMFGGRFTFPNQTKKAIETAAGSRDFEWRNMPLVSVVVKSGDERTAYRKLQNEYFKFLEEYRSTGRLMRKYMNAKDDGLMEYAERINFLENSPEYGRWEIFDEFKGSIDAYRDIISVEPDKEERTRLEAEMYGVMRELVNALHDPESYRNNEQ